jgi:uncharacterized protein with HEPN domain
MTRSPQPYLVHIRQSLAAITAYRPAAKDDLVPQSMAWDAILMRLHDIGENLVQLRHLDEEAFSDPAHASWHRAIGLRHVIGPGYDSIDRDTLWQMLGED